MHLKQEYDPCKRKWNSRQHCRRYDNSNTFWCAERIFAQFTRLLAHSVPSVWISVEIHLSTIGTLYKAPPLLYSVLYIFFVRSKKNFSEFHTVENIEYLQRAKKRSTQEKEKSLVENGNWLRETGPQRQKRKWGIIGISLAYWARNFNSKMYGSSSAIPSFSASPLHCEQVAAIIISFFSPPFFDLRTIFH